MKQIIIFSAILIFVSCKKNIQENTNFLLSKHDPLPQEISTLWVGDPNRTPDIKPIEYEIGYYGIPYGVRISDGNFPKTFYGANYYGQIGQWLRYYCPIENIGVTSDNFYSPLLPKKGDTQYSGADFVFQSPITNPQFLYRAVFQNGLPVSNPTDNYKVEWDGRDGEETYNYNPTLDTRTYLRYYNADTGSLHPMHMDIYFNDVKLPENPSGKYVVVITTNQEDYATHQRLFNEYDYSNNTVTLPVNIENNSVTIDTTALSENIPHPVDSLATNKKGRSVILSWICPYHNTGVIHKFRIKRDGIIIADDWWTEGYTDNTISPNFKSAIYSVEIKIEGLGISESKQIIINRRWR